IFTKHKPLSVHYGLGIENHDQEGRVITLEYTDFWLLTVYTPNSQNELARIGYRMEWEDDFRAYLKKLEETKPVIVCGDLNGAHTEIDLKKPKSNRKSAGFSDEERSKFTQLLDSGYIDTFRCFHTVVSGRFSWWSYRFNARKNNSRLRIDYFFTYQNLLNTLVSAEIQVSSIGSNHFRVSHVVSI